MLSIILFVVFADCFGIELPFFDMAFVEVVAVLAAFGWIFGKWIEECIDIFWKKGKK